ncbi:hypothetical protein [Stieleria mannarensis]|uniref:hypothetical protein n=1 Tax=Stieleria mannarensis TaxID=2755585 RepID=UPI001600B041|nr:hypothetical protein [Rhodopirellula sp. JC639]
MDRVTIRPASRLPGLSPTIGLALVLTWFTVLCFVPDPRPLGAPDNAVTAIAKLTGLSEASSRAATAIALRVISIGMLGFLVTLGVSRRPLWQSALIGFPATSCLAVASLWINHGYFPIPSQIKLAIVSAVIGVAAGLALRKSLVARVSLVAILCGLFLWGIPHGISNDLDRSARITGQHVLAHVDEIPAGDDGFAQCIAVAFRFAAENSVAADPVHANQAAILALGVILGDEHIASVARRSLDPSHHDAIRQLRQKVTLRGRADLPRHFWVSASLTVLADGNRSISIGVMKELMDSNPGGSGFSFVDLVADRAGVLFARAATADETSATSLQRSIRDGLNATDYCPSISALPEGISRDEFQSVYGGLGGEPTKRIVDEIKNRLRQCRALAAESQEPIEIFPKVPSGAGAIE